MVFLDGDDYLNEYYIVPEAESRKLLNVPEVVGYEVYDCLIPSTSQMLYYLKEQKKVTTANILSILRGALNYPLEESCYREHIRVHDISFLSSERVFEADEIAGIIGTLLSVWLYYNFCNWLNVLNCTLPPVGIILVISYFMSQKDYEKTDENLETVNWFAVAGVVIGAIVANVVSWGIASINGMAGA